MNRRSFLKNSAGFGGGLAATDFISYLGGGFGALNPSLAAAAEDHRAESEKPSFLIYWFVEGGWMSYDMFSPVLPTRNNSNFGDLPRDPNAWGAFNEYMYRVKDLKPEDFNKHGEIFHGPLADDGVDLFGEMAIVSSMRAGGGHSTERLRLHYGNYTMDPKARRGPDERTVLQAFCEVYGRPFLLPNLNWHRWLSDGELDMSQYPEGTGFYHALGPAWAHADLRPNAQEPQAVDSTDSLHAKRRTEPGRAVVPEPAPPSGVGRQEQSCHSKLRFRARCLQSVVGGSPTVDRSIQAF